MTTHDETECHVCWLAREISFATDDRWFRPEAERLDAALAAWLGDHADAVYAALAPTTQPGVDVLAGSADGAAFLSAMYDARVTAAHDLAPDALAAAADAAALIAAWRGTGGPSGDELEAAVRR